jgi:hypothetical protein
MKNNCPFCGADIDPCDCLNLYLCNTMKDGVRLYQSFKCTRRQRDQLQAELLEAARLLRDWIECANRESLHDLVSCQETEDFLNAQEPLGKEFEQVLHDNMAELMVKT